MIGLPSVYPQPRLLRIGQDKAVHGIGFLWCPGDGHIAHSLRSCPEHKVEHEHYMVGHIVPLEQKHWGGPPY